MTATGHAHAHLPADRTTLGGAGRRASQSPATHRDPHPLESCLVGQNRRTGEPTALGRVVRRAMLDLGIEGRGAQAELARRAGISEQTAGRVIFTDGYMPDRRTLLGLAAALHLDPAKLALFALDLSDEEPTQQLRPLTARVDRLERSLPEPSRRRFEITLGAVLPGFEQELADADRRAV